MIKVREETHREISGRVCSILHGRQGERVAGYRGSHKKTHGINESGLLRAHGE